MIRLTRARKQAFLDDLRATGVVRHACRAAGVPKQTIYDERNRSAEFARQWQEALDAAIGDAEDRLRKIGEGGQVVVEERTLKDGSTVRRYAQPDSRALMRFLAVRDPAYREHREVEQRVEKTERRELRLSPESLARLSTEEVRTMERILAKAVEGDGKPLH